MLSKIDKLSSATRGPGRWPRWRGLDPTVQQMDGCWQAGSTVYRTVGCAGSDLDPIVSRSKHRANTTNVPYRLNHSKEKHDFPVAGTVAVQTLRRPTPEGESPAGNSYETARLVAYWSLRRRSEV